MHGYYLFLGRGDWGTSREQTLDPTFNGKVPTRILGDWGPHRRGTSLLAAPEWSSSWNAAAWCEHLDFLVDRLQADTLALCMNGYELPYPSESFPEAVESDHANVRGEFFQEVLDHARQRQLAVIAVFCTTGHALGFAAAHPECTTVAADGTRSRENLCHHHPKSQRYAQTIVREMLTRYAGFAGISFHPPENTQPCHCDYCRAAFRDVAGGAQPANDDRAVSDFFWSSCLRFQRGMEELGRSLIPDARTYCITIPGRFEPDFPLVARAIPLTTQILHWDYWSFGERVPDLLRDLELYRAAGHRVGFIPSAGWSLDKLGDNYGQAVREQILLVRRAGCEDILYFVGAIWNEPALLQTATPPPGRC